MRIPPWLACGVILAGVSIGLVPRPAGAAPAQDSPLDAVKEIERRYNEAQSAAYEAYDKATTDEERAAALKTLPGKEFIPDFRAAAEAAKGTDTAVRAWMWVLRLEDDGKQAWEVVDLLLSEHMDSLALSQLASHLSDYAPRYGEDHATEGLRALVAGSPHDRVRAPALFGLGKVLLASKSGESRAEGRDCMAAVIEEYGTVQAGGTTYGALAEGTVFELEKLQIGMVAPDFETIDENGVAWKLSDYRGKVVVVDFWGFW